MTAVVLHDVFVVTRPVSSHTGSTTSADHTSPNNTLHDGVRTLHDIVKGTEFT